MTDRCHDRLTDKAIEPAATSIALFGGTFDPPHLGHLAMARRALDECALDRVIFLPCRQSPHKENAACATGDQRLEMLRLALEGEDWAAISDHELTRSEPSYSWQTVAHHAAQFPDARLFWILGHDQWQVIDTWARPDYLRDHVEFIVFPREGAQPVARPEYRAVLIDDFAHPASATRIREALAAGAPESVTDWLHPAVADYISQSGLYPA